MQKIAFLLLVAILALSERQVLAQATDSTRLAVDTTIFRGEDSRLDSLVAKHVRVNMQADGFAGYRIQLFSGSGNSARQEANELRAEFLTLYPDVPAYLIYQSPNFKVRVGDLRSELEAVRLQRELSYQYPGCFVVKDLIKFPALKIDRKIDPVPEENEEPSSETDTDH